MYGTGASGRVLMLLVVVTVLAGCSGATTDSDSTNTPVVTTDVPTEEPTAIPTSTDSPTPTPPLVHPANPYGSENLTVAVVDDSRTGYDRTAELQEAFEFWEEHSAERPGYPVRFERDDDAPDPDIVVRFVDEIGSCGLHGSDGRTLGCADLVRDSAPSPVEIEVRNEFDRDTTAGILTHEFGHALGLDHDGGPRGVMRESIATAPMEVEVTYAVDVDSSYHAGAVDDQIDGAVEFVESGANGTIASDVTMTEVDDPSGATVHMEISGDRDACGGDVYCVEYNLDCYVDDDCTLTDAAGTELTTANMEHEYLAFVLANDVFFTLQVLGAAEDRPRELDPDETDPSTTWWR